MPCLSVFLTRFRAFALISLCIAILVVLVLSGSSPLQAMNRWLAEDAPSIKMPDYITQTGRLVSPKHKEISGIVRSKQYPQLLWIINDSGNSPVIYGVNMRGEIIAAVDVDTANIDWEDLTLVEQHGRYWLVIADIGDNRAVRKTVRLIWLAEPSPQATKAEPAYIQTFQYEKGPRDSESLAFDAARQQMLIISKRRVPAELFTLPIPDMISANPKHTVAVKQAELQRLPQPDAEAMKQPYGKYTSQPTAMDIQGNKLLVMTYRHAYIYQRQPGQGFEQAVAQLPQTVALHLLDQQEAVAWSDESSFIYVSEGKASPMLRVQMPEGL